MIDEEEYDGKTFDVDMSGNTEEFVTSHVAILSKYNGVERHLLVVTRRFEDQRALLTPGDVAALWRCLSEYPALGFYNGGVEAGASQPHKHLQLVPLPLAPEGPPVPIEPLIAGAIPAAPGGVATLPGFDFLHAFARLGGADGGRTVPARVVWETYRTLLAHLGQRAPSGGAVLELQSCPYCLLVTRGWMLLVPRQAFRDVLGLVKDFKDILARNDHIPEKRLTSSFREWLPLIL